MNKYKNRGREIGELVEQKNKEYGNACQRAGQMLEILYPKFTGSGFDIGIAYEICIKLCRISTGATKDSYADIVGYGIIGDLQHESKSNVD